MLEEAGSNQVEEKTNIVPAGGESEEIDPDLTG